MIFKKTIIILLMLSIGFSIPIAAAEIHKAAKDGDFETVKKLLEKDPNLINTGNRLQQTPLLLKPQVITITPPLNSIAEVTIKGIKVKILRLNYGGDFQNLGYIIKMEGKTLFFMGDAVMKNNEDTIKKLG